MLASRGGNSGDRECFFSRSPKTCTWEFTKLSSNKLGGVTVGREAKTMTASRSFSDSLARSRLNFSARSPLSVETKEAQRVREDEKGLIFRLVGGIF